MFMLSLCVQSNVKMPAYDSTCLRIPFHRPILGMGPLNFSVPYPRQCTVSKLTESQWLTVLEGITETGHRLFACFAVSCLPLLLKLFVCQTALSRYRNMLYFSYQNFGQREFWFLCCGFGAVVLKFCQRNSEQSVLLYR